MDFCCHMCNVRASHILHVPSNCKCSQMPAFLHISHKNLTGILSCDPFLLSSTLCSKPCTLCTESVSLHSPQKLLLWCCHSVKNSAWFTILSGHEDCFCFTSDYEEGDIIILEEFTCSFRSLICFYFYYTHGLKIDFF